MKYETNRRYRVVSRSGRVFTGFIETESFGSMTVHVFADCFRVIHPESGVPAYTAVPPAQTYLAPRFLLATVNDPETIEPLDLVPHTELPYGAVQDGTWYHAIRVPYTPLPANAYTAR